MLLNRSSHCSFLLNVLCILAAELILIFATGRSMRAQTAETLLQVKKVYVESFGQDDMAGKVRERVIQQLRRDEKLAIVNDPKEADAVLKGSCTIWITGYFSTDPHALAATRQANYEGFLSVEIVGKGSEPLWSYMVTPTKFSPKFITDDLADHIVKELVATLEQKAESVPTPVMGGTAERVLNGAGAAFPAPLYQEWFESFQQRRPNLHIIYNSVGSEAGIQMLMQGKVDFAGLDTPLSDQRMSESKTPLLHFATALAAVVPIYNLQDVDESLNFTGEILAGIYLGKIKSWNDPKIREANRYTHLPDSPIVVIHCSDENGITFLWTDYLSKVNPEWEKTVGRGSVVRWPVGEGAEGNEGIANLVQKTPNSIGYVGWVYALRHQLNAGAVRNAAGEFILADLDSVSAAAEGVPRAMTSDFRVSITDAPGKDAYPIATFTWWLLPRDLDGGEKKPALVDLLQWVLTSGQKQCSGLGYAPLPRETAKQELELLDTLK